MSIESNVPRDNKPNIEPEFDIMRSLIDTQAEHDRCDDELDQFALGIGMANELNRKLETALFRVSLSLTNVGMQIEGVQGIYTFTSEEVAIRATGTIGFINYGKVSGVMGMVAHLVDTNAQINVPGFSADEPPQVMMLVPIAKVLDYDYLPIDGDD